MATIVLLKQRGKQSYNRFYNLVFKRAFVPYFLRQRHALLHVFQKYFLTSSMRHPKQKSHLDGSKSDLIARCFSVRKSVFVK